MATPKTGMQDIDSMVSFLDSIEGDVSKLDDTEAPEAESKSKDSPSSEKLPTRSEDLTPPPESTEHDGEDTEDGDTEEEEETTEASAEDAGADAETEELDAAEFASYFGLGEEDVVVQDDGTVAFRYKVGDETGAATLKDLVRGYQLERNLNRKSEQLSEEVKQTQTARTQLLEAIDAQNDLLESLKEQVTQKYSDTDWKELESEDPGRAALMRQHMAEEYQGLESRLAKNQEKRQAAIQHALQEQEKQLATFFEQEEERFVAKVPEWNDPTKREELTREFRGYLTGLGFNDNEMSALRDHRIMLMVRDAVNYRKLKTTKLPAAEKKVVRVPRRLKAGSKPEPERAKVSKRRKDAFTRLRKSGSDKDAAAAFLAIDAV